METLQYMQLYTGWVHAVLMESDDGLLELLEEWLQTSSDDRPRERWWTSKTVSLVLAKPTPVRSESGHNLVLVRRRGTDLMVWSLIRFSPSPVCSMHFILVRTINVKRSYSKLDDQTQVVIYIYIYIYITNIHSFQKLNSTFNLTYMFVLYISLLYYVKRMSFYYWQQIATKLLILIHCCHGNTSATYPGRCAWRDDSGNVSNSFVIAMATGTLSISASLSTSALWPNWYSDWKGRIIQCSSGVSPQWRS